MWAPGCTRTATLMLLLMLGAPGAARAEHAPGAAATESTVALQGDCRRVRPGETADRQGCPQVQRIALRGIQFKGATAEIDDTSLGVLAAVAETLRAYPQTRFVLEVHVEPHPGLQAPALALRRAEAIREVWTQAGVAADRVQPTARQPPPADDTAADPRPPGQPHVFLNEQSE